jgi:putative tryptophan/tyrosine transport system substrate-binding protein
MTGTTSLGLTLAPKRVEILHELVPSTTKIALLENPTDATRTTQIERQNIEAAADAVGWQFEVVRASSVGEFDAAFATLIQDRVGALIIGTDTFFYSEMNRLASLAMRHALPAAGPLRDFPTAGGLMSYSASIPSVYRQVGIYTGKVLNGVKPADLPVLERASEIAVEFVRLKADIIVTWATALALAAKHATTTIPIVFALATDAVGSGLVASLARPGGNLTGLSALNIDLIGKRIELFREIVPRLRRLAIMANVGVLDTAAEMREVAATSRTLGLDVKTFEIRRADEIAPAFEVIKDGADALFVVGDPVTYTNRAQIIALAQDAKLPTSYAIREFVLAGGLMSYGTNFPDLFRRTATFVDKILRGARPADIPVEQPTKFDFVINLKTARGLDVTEMQKLEAYERNRCCARSANLAH